MIASRARAASLRRVVLLMAFVVAPLAVAAEAQIVAPAGRTLFNDGVLVRSVFRVDHFKESESGEDLTRFRSVNALVWGVRPHTSLSLVVPLVRTEQRGAGPGHSTTGTGDLSVFARHDVLRRTVPGGYTRLAPELGFKVPTGGAFGTGSTDVVLGLVFSHVRDRDWWISDIQVTLPGTGDDDLRAGERHRFDLAYLRRVLPRRGRGGPTLLAVLELNGESANETRRGGVPVAGTGGNLISLSPGLEYILGRRLVLEASIPIPVYEDLGEALPKPRLSTILGLRWLF